MKQTDTLPLIPTIQSSFELKPVISTKLQITILVITSLLIILTVTLNSLMSMPLFIHGINFIYKYQQSNSSIIIRTIQNIISIVSGGYGVRIESLIYYLLTKRKLLVSVHLFCFYLASYVLRIFNLSVQQTRPVWYDQRILFYDWICSKDFGSPSDHCFHVIFIFEPIISDFIGYRKYHILAIPMGILIILMPIARLYLGVHSLDQVLLGLTYGFLILIAYKYIYQIHAYQLLWQFLHYKRKYLKIFLLILSHILIITIPILIYIDNLQNKKADFHLLQRLNKLCYANKTWQVMQADMIMNCTTASFSFGIVYGILILKNKIEFKRYFLGMWHYQKFYMWFVHLIITILFIVSPIQIFKEITPYVIPQNHYIFIFIFNCIGLTLGGIGLTLPSPMLMVKFKVINVQNIEKQEADVIDNL